jgi:hypothetical protein
MLLCVRDSDIMCLDDDFNPAGDRQFIPRVQFVNSVAYLTPLMLLVATFKLLPLVGVTSDE